MCVCFSQFETAAAEVLVSLRSKVAGETGEMEDPITGDVQVLLTSREDPVSMRFLGVSGFFFSVFLFLVWLIRKLMKLAGK